MKFKFLLLICFAFLIGCKEEDMSPIEGDLNKALLEKNIWKNEVNVDEQFTDNSDAQKYMRVSTISFTGSHYSQSVSKHSSSLQGVPPDSSYTEFWGEYVLSGADSILTLHYKIHSDMAERWIPNSDSLVFQTRFKIISLTEQELAIKPLLDSLKTSYSPVMTYKAVK